jgi:hypothetical protein
LPSTLAGIWLTKSCLKYIAPSDTTITVGIKRVGSGTNPAIIVA